MPEASKSALLGQTLGTALDYDKSVHHPVELTFAEVQTQATALDVTKAGLIAQLKELYVVHVAQRQWAEAQKAIILLGQLQGFFEPVAVVTPPGGAGGVGG